MKKIGFVIPWYYEDIRGGAEQEMRGLVKHLHEAGVDVEIITTCVKDFASDWTENYFKEGIDTIDGVTVRRFKTEHERIPKIFSALDSEMLSNPDAGTDLSDRWIEHMGPYCPELVEYVDKHQDEYK